MKKSYFTLYFLILFSAFTSINAQEKEDKESKKVHFNAFPYLNYSNTLELFYGAGGLLTFKTAKNDTIPPISTVGSVYFRTTNGSWSAFAFSKLYFDEDKWRVMAASGTGKFNFQTYMEIPEEEPDFYDYSSRSTMAAVRVLRKIKGKNFAGIGYYFNTVETDFDELAIDSISTTHSLQFVYLNDTRNNVYYPTKGNYINVSISTYPKWMSNENNYNIISAYFNKYYSRSNSKNVWAFRAYTKFGTSALDFQKQVYLSGVDLRGYTDGKYRGNSKFDIQAEYRWNFAPKMGVVGFGGLGTLYGSDIDDFNGKLYSSIGAGFRYLAIKSTNMRLGFDVARGKDDFAFYFRIGEAF